MFLLFGCAFAGIYLVPAASTAAPGLPDLPVAAQRIIRVAAILAFVSGLGWLFATLASMGGGFAGALDPEFLHVFFFETPFGPIATVRLVLLAALVVPAIAPIRSRGGAAATATIATLLLVSQAWLGHAAEGGKSLYGALMVGSYAAHVLAGAAWVGGLPALVVAIDERRRRARGADEIFHILSRFSAMAIVAVSVIVVSGVADAAFRVGSDLGALVSTTYGTVLFVKLGFVALMLGLAWYNRFRAMPRLRQARQDDVGLGAGRLRRSIVVELALGGLVLGAVAVLGITPPPR